VGGTVRYGEGEGEGDVAVDRVVVKVEVARTALGAAGVI
jgi:hypothetical protein